MTRCWQEKILAHLRNVVYMTKNEKPEDKGLASHSELLKTLSSQTGLKRQVKVKA
jgi:hypothetical protein